MKGQYNEYWETDEFEDLVARSIIGLYETKLKRQKRVPKSVRFDEDTLKRFRNIGCYFAPGDREFYITHTGNSVDDGKFSASQHIDMINDGLPDRAVLSFKSDNQGDSYLYSFYLEKLSKLPKPWKSDIWGKFYRITQLHFSNDYLWGGGTILVANKQGELQSCYLEGTFENPHTGRPIHLKKHRPVVDVLTGCEDYYTVWGLMTIQSYQDRRYLWNVQAQEGIAKSTFGVYPEQIKSLFYARSLPETTTGRKRPILHWVQAHQRRMKSGTEVDVDQYLRGTHEFVMNGTKFKIVNPMKETK